MSRWEARKGGQGRDVRTPVPVGARAEKPESGPSTSHAGSRARRALMTSGVAPLATAVARGGARW